MEDIDNPSADRPTSTRTSQACQRCRSLKTRCLPSQQPGTCQRCSTSKRECTWADVPRRVKRTRGPSRIAQVEQKIDGIFASLVNPDIARPTPTPTESSDGTRTNSTPGGPSNDRPLAPGSWLPFPSSFSREPSRTDLEAEASRKDAEPTQEYLNNLRDIHTFADNTDISRPPDRIFQSNSHREPPIKSDLVKQLLSSGEADSLLIEYRTMSKSFPFVPVPLDVTMQDLSIAKPMLCLAVLTVASWKEHTRQMKLDVLYRTEFANRTIIRPRRTLSLLQSVLVYLSWYHFVFSHKTQQIFFLQQLAIGLALDMGLHQKITRGPIDVPGRPKPQQPAPSERRERQRTYLGCYFLSSMIAGGLQKPNLLKHSEYMAECGRSLRLDLEYPSDVIIGHLISLRRLDDQIHEAFYSEEAIELPITDSRILMNLRFMESQLEEWKREVYGEEFRQVLDLSFSFTEMQLHSIGLRMGSPSFQQTSANPTQLNALLSSLEAGKRFLDLLLAFPVSDYHLISFSEWMRIPYVVMTISRLSIPNEAHTAAQWDVKAAQDRVRLDLYLESLCYRMQGLSTYEKPKQPHPDFWWAMRMIMDLTRSWYCKKIKPQKALSTQPTPGDFPTPETLNSSSLGNAQSSGPPQTPVGECAFPVMGSMPMGAPGELSAAGSDDPFAFMHNMNFEMDQFLDMGIWGPESYEGMGFGGGGMGF